MNGRALAKTCQFDEKRSQRTIVEQSFAGPYSAVGYLESAAGKVRDRRRYSRMRSTAGAPHRAVMKRFVTPKSRVVKFRYSMPAVMRAIANRLIARTPCLQFVCPCTFLRAARLQFALPQRQALLRTHLPRGGTQRNRTLGVIFMLMREANSGNSR